MKKKPTTKEQLELMSIDKDWTDAIKIPRTKDTWKISWLKPSTQEKLSELELKEGLEVSSEDTLTNVKKRSRFASKAAAYIILNGLKANLFHWIFWRYLYFIKGYSSDQLRPIIEIAKKKAMPTEYLMCSVLISHMKITNPTMTKEESEHFQSELTSALNQPLEKNTDGH